MPEGMMSIPTARRETSDVTGLFIALTFIGLICLLGLAGLVTWWIFPRSVHTGFIPYPVPAFPPPQLQASPHQDFVRFYRQELDRLNSVGWVNKQQGIAHIPIQQAMQDIAKQGIPAWPTTAKAAAAQIARAEAELEAEEKAKTRGAGASGTNAVRALKATPGGGSSK